VLQAAVAQLQEAARQKHDLALQAAREARDAKRQHQVGEWVGE